jgi:para-nitrobenzyl esterase
VLIMRAVALKRFVPRGSVAAIVVLALTGRAPLAQDATPIATLQGPVTGVERSGVVAYKGIPFAAPPVGERRWMPPQPPQRRSGRLQAAAYGPACPQPDREDGGGVGRMASQNEDCLTLNIWTPVKTTASAGRPVMVWIHGGAHRLGSGSAALYDGTELARQGVVAVTINYRLGLLGYFAHPAITASAAKDDPLGNYGVMDQLAALTWVRDNIAAFGGNPANVTVFGESAGAADILFLLTLPQAKGLFARAIVESGGGLQRPTTLAEQEKRGVGYASAIGLAADARLADLKARPAADWIAAQGGLQGGLGFGPFVDGRLIIEAPWVAFRDGRAHDVPLLIGANSNEASVLATLGVPAAALSVALGNRLPAFRALYGPSLAEDEFRRQAMGDVVFVAPSRWVAAQASGGAPSFLYYFSYVAMMRRGAVPGAGHGPEIPDVFKTWANTALAKFLSEQDRAMSNTMSACWVAFATSGTPSCAGAPPWPAYTPARDEQMEFGEVITVRQPARREAFDLFVNQFMTLAGNVKR